jgi:hypothetical protein
VGAEGVSKKVKKGAEESIERIFDDDWILSALKRDVRRALASELIIVCMLLLCFSVKRRMKSRRTHAVTALSHQVFPD